MGNSPQTCKIHVPVRFSVIRVCSTIFFFPNVYGEERANFSQPLKRCAPTPTTHSIDLVAELSIVLIVTPHVSKEFPPQKAV